MKKVSVKLVYDTPRADLVIVKAEKIICASTNFGTSLDDMDEDDYGWEI